MKHARLVIMPLIAFALSLNANGTPKTNAATPAIASWLSNNTVTAGRSRGAAPVRRAVLIGINTYEPSYDEMKRHAEQQSKRKKGRGLFINLDGCVNDAEELRGVLIARFGFDEKNILLLTNQQATRDAILSACQKQLVDASQPGDIAFFYYAGHGSQVVNSLSEEHDKRDETIVPADSWTGVPDIRDKELRVLFNKAIRKGAIFTAIFDSCHSGSITRGIAPTKTRHAAPILDDIADATKYPPSPEESGGLVLAAAQDDQSAEEQNAATIPHGAFTAALLDVLRTVQIGRSASEIFLGVASVLQASGHSQVPVLAGIEQRRNMGLFGGTAGLSGKVSVAVTRLAGREATLQGGRAAGLNVGCRLTRPSNETNRSPVTLEITSVENLMASKASVVAGNAADIQAGDVFEVSTWTASPEASLKVWLPDSVPPSRIDSIMKTVDQLRSSGAVELIEDPERTAPTHVMLWKSGHWQLTGPDSRTTSLDADVDMAHLLAAIGTSSEHAKLFVSFPLSTAVSDSLNIPGKNQADGLQIEDQPANANYMLLGSYIDGSVRYAWMFPTASAGQNENLPLPVRSYWFPTNGQTESSSSQIAWQLRDTILRIGKIKGWLTLQSPTDDGTFPYRLALKNQATGELIDGRGLQTGISTETGRSQTRPRPAVVKGGESFDVLLHADPAALAQGCSQRYVYVFGFDIDGRSQLVWPPGGQGNSQRFPPPSLNGDAPQEFFKLRHFTVGKPFGIDTYVMLTSADPIPDVTVLNSDAVTTSTRGVRDSNPLQRLLRSVGGGKRGMDLEVPANWSIQRISVRSVAR